MPKLRLPHDIYVRIGEDGVLAAWAPRATEFVPLTLDQVVALARVAAGTPPREALEDAGFVARSSGEVDAFFSALISAGLIEDRARSRRGRMLLGALQGAGVAIDALIRAGRAIRTELSDPYRRPVPIDRVLEKIEQVGGGLDLAWSEAPRWRSRSGDVQDVVRTPDPDAAPEASEPVSVSVVAYPLT